MSRGNNKLLVGLNGLLLVLTGCAQYQPLPALAPGALSDCESLFLQVDHAIDKAGVRDHGPARVSGFPYLRVDRFLVSFRTTVSGKAQLQAWTERLAELDAEARALELQTLGQPVAGLDRQRLERKLDSCRSSLVNNLLQDPVRLDRLRHDAVVPDDYVTGWRVAGLYPLAVPIVSHRIRKGQDEVHQLFAIPLAQLPVAGKLIRWGEPAMSRLPTSGLSLDHDALGIPLPSRKTLQQLFRRYAPTWEVDVVDDNDLLGTPVWQKGAAVDTQHATEYRLLSHARFGDQVLLQLNYVIWFKARPGEDIYAGRFDGLIWRVTLGPDGEPWLYDSIHGCGCYHNFFPAGPLQLRQDLPQDNFEPPLIPQRAVAGPLVVRLDHGRHYIVRVYHDNGVLGRRSLAVEDYARLRSLPASGGYHSLFGQYGLIAGSERPERFILWPMGVRSPGAMRQWGHHAVAFIGRRHFDDPWLIQSLFMRETH